MVLTKEFKEMTRDAAKKMKGAAKRAFMAQITRNYLGGSPRKGERELGWYRKSIEKGLKEQETGICCVDNYAARGRKKTEEKLAYLERDIRDLVESDSQVDPKFKTSFRYMRISARAVREALIRDKSYRDEQLPCRQTIGAILNRLGYRLKNSKNRGQNTVFTNILFTIRDNKPHGGDKCRANQDLSYLEFRNTLYNEVIIASLVFSAPSKAWCFLPGASPGRERDQDGLSQGLTTHPYPVLRLWRTALPMVGIL
jgi:hypothetical protein